MLTLIAGLPFVCLRRRLVLLGHQIAARGRMNNDFIVPVYVAIDETLRALGHRGHPLAQINDAGVPTVAAVAAEYFHTHHERSLQVLQPGHYLSGRLSAPRASTGGSGRDGMFVGVDTHKKTHVLVVIDTEGRTLGSRTVANTPERWAAALQWARQQSHARWGVENSGPLGKGFAQVLLTQGEGDVREVVPHRTAQYRRCGRTQDKTDAADALAMARLLGGADAVPPSRPSVRVIAATTVGSRVARRIEGATMVGTRAVKARRAQSRVWQEKRRDRRSSRTTSPCPGKSATGRRRRL